MSDSRSAETGGESCSRMWDYRVVRRLHRGESWLQICEVYFDDDGLPYAFCGATAEGETEEELGEDVRGFTEALSKPVIDEREITANRWPEWDEKSAIPIEEILKEFDDAGGSPDE